jgi:adenine-specific DNA-methyltransferase
LGNKSRLTDWIVGIISRHVPQGALVADPMCGTAAVSRRLADQGFSVVASDELRFPILHAKARLLPYRRCDFRRAGGNLEAAIATLNHLPEHPGFFWREYSAAGTPANGSRPRAYFTGANAAKIDSIRAQILEWHASGLNADAVDLLLHYLILAANSVANIAGTYGYYRSTWSRASLAPIRLEATPGPADEDRDHRVTQGRVEDVVADLDVFMCYLDPPYTKRQYGGNYHILETLALQDEPEPVGEGGLRDWYSQYSDFCSKRRVREALSETIKRLKAPYLSLSYSEDGLVPADEMWDLLARFGRVARKELALTRFRSNDGRSNKAGPVMEHLYILERQ